jgi:hypothetical protein
MNDADALEQMCDTIKKLWAPGPGREVMLFWAKELATKVKSDRDYPHDGSLAQPKSALHRHPVCPSKRKAP